MAIFGWEKETNEQNEERWAGAVLVVLVSLLPHILLAGDHRENCR